MPTNFEDRARTWDDDPAKVERARAVATAIRAAVPLGPSTRLLEYGAGTGLLSQALAGDVGPVTLAEPSPGMRSVMAEKVADAALPRDARVWDLDLATNDVPDEQFDVIASVMTLHHIPHVELVLRGFAALLDDGGHVCIADLEQEDGSFHDDDPAFDGHQGFATAELRKLLEAEGFTDVRVTRCHEVQKAGRTYPLFLMTAEVQLR